MPRRKPPKPVVAPPPGPDPAIPRLPPLPEVVTTVSGPFTVELVDGMIEQDGCYGSITWQTRVIKLDASMVLHSAWATLFHELAHAWFIDAGMSGVALPSKLEERLCDVIATARMHELLRGLEG